MLLHKIIQIISIIKILNQVQVIFKLPKPWFE